MKPEDCAWEHSEQRIRSRSDVPNAELFGFDPVGDRFSKIGEVLRGAMLFKECSAVIVSFIQQDHVGPFWIKADIELMTPRLLFQ